jgi:hypothetical protein
LYGPPFNVDDGTAVFHEGLRGPSKEFVAGTIPGFFAGDYAAVDDQGQCDSPLDEKGDLVTWGRG